MAEPRFLAGDVEQDQPVPSNVQGQHDGESSDFGVLLCPRALLRSGVCGVVLLLLFVRVSDVTLLRCCYLRMFLM